MTLLRLLATWLLWTVALFAQAVAATPLAINVSAIEASALQIDKTVEVFEDTSAQRTLEDIAGLSNSMPGGFQPATQNRLRPGFSRSAFWLRMSISNDTNVTRDLRLVLPTSWLQHVDFHVERPREGHLAWTHEQAGVSDDLQGLHLLNRVPTLAIQLQPAERVRVLARVQSDSRPVLTLDLHSAEDWIHSERRRSLIDGLMIGSFLVFAVYSLSLWALARKPHLAFQATTFALMALYESTYQGYARIALWPGSVEWSYRATHVVAGFAILGLMLCLYAAARRTSVRIPGLPILTLLGAVEVIVMLGCMLGPYASFARVGFVNAPLVIVALTVSTFIYQRRPGTAGQLAFALMLLISAAAVLRTIDLRIIDAYALSFPGMLVGLFAFTGWSYHVDRKKRDAQSALLQWQALEQERLEEEVMRKTRALNEALEQAERRSQEKTQLLAYISHDLRAPASTIIGNVRLMRAGAVSHEERLEAIERSAAYQLTLIADLVDYAKSELLPFSFDEQPVRLATLMEDIAQYANVLAARQNNKFDLEVIGTLPAGIYIDSKRFQQLLLNLLSNAAKFTRNAKISLRLQAQPLDDAWQLDFEVSDSGIGIDHDVQVRIAKALAEDAPSSLGDGLGLVIARRIVQHMRGHLVLKSKLGEGTRVNFSLTVRNAPEALLPAPAVSRMLNPKHQIQQRSRRLPTINPISPSQQADLEQFARDGRWSDLHEWANRLASDPHHASLVAAVRQGLDRLDFEQIRLLARAVPIAKTESEAR